MRRSWLVITVGSLLLIAGRAGADDASGLSSGFSSGIQPGEPWIDDGSTLYPPNDRDIDFSDDTPHLTFRDSDTSVAWQFHVEDAAADPYRGLTLWQGTQASSGGTFTIGTAKPSLRVNQSGALFFDLLQTVSAARCLELAATGQVTLASAACGTGSGGNSFETIDVPAGTNPVADSATDTLTITETSFLTLTGTAGTDTIDITQVTTDLGTDGLIAANAVALSTDTTGNFVATIADAGNANITVANSGAENAAITLDVVDVTCTGCLSATELGTDSVSADELNATGVEAELEAALDIGGEVTSTGMASTAVADSLTVASWTLTSATVSVADDVDFTLGTDSDWTLNYDESVDNQLLVSTNNDSAIATTDPMFEILTDFNTASGTNMTANQEVFGVGKGTQAANVSLFTVDEDGDGLFAGTLGVTGGLTLDANTEANIEAGVDLDGDVTAVDLDTTVIAANAVALGTDTTGAYVSDLTAGTYIDVSGGGAETANVTVTMDATEVEAVTWGAGGNASNTWTVALSGTDPTMVFGSDEIRLPNNVVVGGGSLSGKLAVDGDFDEIQLLVQGNSTQTSNLAVFENSAGTDQWVVTNAGNATATGTISAGGTAQSTITEGLLVNNGSGTDEDDDFTVNTAGGTFEVDAGDGALRGTLDQLGLVDVDGTDNTAGTAQCGSNTCVFGILNATGAAMTGVVDCADTAADQAMCLAP